MINKLCSYFLNQASSAREDFWDRPTRRAAMGPGPYSTAVLGHSVLLYMEGAKTYRKGSFDVLTSCKLFHFRCSVKSELCGLTLSESYEYRNRIGALMTYRTIV